MSIGGTSYRCQINHPSQKHHECLQEMPDYFYAGHVDYIIDTLYDKYMSYYMNQAGGELPGFIGAHNRVRG